MVPSVVVCKGAIENARILVVVHMSGTARRTLTRLSLASGAEVWTAAWGTGNRHGRRSELDATLMALAAPLLADDARQPARAADGSARPLTFGGDGWPRRAAGAWESIELTSSGDAMLLSGLSNARRCAAAERATDVTRPRAD